MRSRTFPLLGTAFGLATIVCLWIVGPLVSSTHNAVYHWSGSASGLFGPAFIDFFCVWAILSILFLVTKRNDTARLALWAAVTTFLPWITLKSVALLTDWQFPHWFSRVLFVVSLTAFVLILLYRKRIDQRVVERVQEGVITVSCFVALAGAFLLGEAVWFAWKARGLNASRPPHQATISAGKHQLHSPRIIWIVLDELSYQQVYGERVRTLALPTFDRLANEATVFTDTIPAGIKTEVILPSLISGLPLDTIRSAPNGRALLVHGSQQDQWLSFKQHDTIFQDALDAGYKTAVVGWYNPYCRILPEVLDQCSWFLDAAAQNKMLPHASILSNFLQPMAFYSDFLGKIFTRKTHKNNMTEVLSRLHIKDYQQIATAADHVLEDPSFDFVLLHLPIPHPGGIYDRATGKFAVTGGDYIDNLALADAYLAHVRELLERQGQWDSAAVVIMGDHSWRTKLLWTSTPEWSAEEQAASHGGVFDTRPVYLVKMPYQRSGSLVTTAFEAIRTRDLLLSFIEAKINTTDQLLAWANRPERK